MSACDFKPQIVGVCGRPNVNATRHVTLDLLIWVKESENVVQCHVLKQSWWGGNNGLAVIAALDDSMENKSKFFNDFWTGRIECQKNREWWGFSRACLIQMAKRRLKGACNVAEDCVVRFLAYARIDPWRACFMGWQVADEAFSNQSFRWMYWAEPLTLDQWMQLRGELISKGYCALVKYALAKKTRTLSGVVRETAYDLQVMRGDQLTWRNDLYDRLEQLKPWALKPRKTPKETMIKAVRRAASKARISTENARAWFKKFNALTVLSRWGKRATQAGANAL